MFSLLRQRTMRCRTHVAPLVLICALGFLICPLSSASAASIVNPDAGPQVIVPQATALNPGRALVALSPEQTGDLLMARGNYAAAVHAYQRGPLTSAVVWDKIGIAYHHMSELSHAQKAYRTALKIDPHYPSALNNLGVIYYGKRQYKRAERTYRRALKYQTDAAIIYSNLGTAYFAEAKYGQGREAYQAAFRLDPNVFSSEGALLKEISPPQQLRAMYYYLASMYASAGRKQAALDYLRQAFGEGFSDRKQLLADKDFDPIRSSPEFQQLLLEQHFD